MKNNVKSLLDLNELVQNHLDLQVKISYVDHHDFLLQHGFTGCHSILDIGCGNGTFSAKLALDHPHIKIVGIDKRAHCVDSSNQLHIPNYQAFKIDIFSNNIHFDFSLYDGFLMRYFFLHVDHAQKILSLLKNCGKKQAKVWVIDLNWRQIRCEPYHPTGELLQNLVKEFCEKISPETMGGENVAHLLDKNHFKNIKVQENPFTSLKIPQYDFIKYLKQEVACYTLMIGKSLEDSNTQKILTFLDEEVSKGIYQISYGMVLISAEI